MTPEFENLSGARPSQTAASDRQEAVGGPILFDAVLEPHRALPRSGFIVVMLAAGVITLGIGIFFLALGAWPVFGFLGLDLLLLWLAFKLNARALRIVERICITPEKVLVTRQRPRGQESWEFNPYWLNVRLNESADGKGALHLSSHGFSLSLGAFLVAEERHALAESLRQALADLRRAT
jgi:uncharacterized membrane protein